MRFIALVLMLIPFTVSAAGAAEQAIPFKTVATGNASGIRTESQVVIRTSSAWRALWQKHAAGQPRSAMPVVDFSRDMVVAVFAGEVSQFTRVSILRVSRETKRLSVLVGIAEFQPGPVPTEPGTATPFHIIRLARSSVPVVFVQAQVPEKNLYQPGR